MNILNQITDAKKIQVEKRKKETSIATLEKSDLFFRSTISLRSTLLDANKNGIIAEFKRRSPSKGLLNDHVNAADVCLAYQQAGVSGISVLTETDFFSGSDEDLLQTRATVSIPVLRKDFIIDAYQIYEAKSIGADVILLIAAILSKETITKFSRLAKELGLEVLLEVHSKKELEESLVPEATFVGVNNRNLDDFSVDVNTSFELADQIPSEFLKISESAISSPQVIHALRKAGFNGFLIGETFMKQSNPGEAIKAFTDSLL